MYTITIFHHSLISSIFTLVYLILDGESETVSESESSESEPEPPARDYTQCVQLHGPPRTGDVIAFKVSFPILPLPSPSLFLLRSSLLGDDYTQCVQLYWPPRTGDIIAAVP